jgi:hypothetical protein
MAYNFVTKVILERHAHTKYTAQVMYYRTLFLSRLQQVKRPTDNTIYPETNPEYNYRYVQTYVAHYVSLYRIILEQKVNILGGGSIGNCRKNSHEHLSNSEWLPTQSYFIRKLKEAM